MKVFIAGSRAMNRLNYDIQNRITSIILKGATVLVGDANGADTLVQNYLKEKNYQDVIVYASNGRVRNNLNNWPVNNVPTNIKYGTFEFYTAKDKKMAEDADCGLMIWDGKSRGTLNDTLMLTNLGKIVVIYHLPSQKFYNFKSVESLFSFVSRCDQETLKMYKKLLYKLNGTKTSDSNLGYNQLSIFE